MITENRFIGYLVVFTADITLVVCFKSFKLRHSTFSDLMLLL